MTDYLTKIILGNSIQDYIIFALIIITGLVLKNIIIKSFSNIILKISKNDKDKIPEIDIFVNRSHANYIYNLIIDGTKNLDF